MKTKLLISTVLFLSLSQTFALTELFFPLKTRSQFGEPNHYYLASKKDGLYLTYNSLNMRKKGSVLNIYNTNNEIEFYISTEKGVYSKKNILCKKTFDCSQSKFPLEEAYWLSSPFLNGYEWQRGIFISNGKIDIEKERINLEYKGKLFYIKFKPGSISTEKGRFSSGNLHDEEGTTVFNVNKDHNNNSNLSGFINNKQFLKLEALAKKVLNSKKLTNREWAFAYNIFTNQKVRRSTVLSVEARGLFYDQYEKNQKQIPTKCKNLKQTHINGTGFDKLTKEDKMKIFQCNFELVLAREILQIRKGFPYVMSDKPGTFRSNTYFILKRESELESLTLENFYDTIYGGLTSYNLMAGAIIDGKLRMSYYTFVQNDIMGKYD